MRSGWGQSARILAKQHWSPSHKAEGLGVPTTIQPAGSE